MSLATYNPSITTQLSQAIKKMRDFLLENPSDQIYYQEIYEEITKLSIKAKTEGYNNYEHKNPYKVLSDFVKQNDKQDLVVKYYSIPNSWTKEFIKHSKIQKKMNIVKKIIEWIINQISKFKPDIKA